MYKVMSFYLKKKISYSYYAYKIHLWIYFNIFFRFSVKTIYEILIDFKEFLFGKITYYSYKIKITKKIG